ncbi:MAG: sugar ABC transporter substrate-binding protein [Chloroflexota bacterium]
MRKSRFVALSAAVALSIAAVGPVAADEIEPMDPGAAAGTTLLLDMKGPGNANPFWAAVEHGATDAGAAYGITVLVQAPTVESDVPSQINQIEDAIVAGVAGIALAPTDPAALAPAVQQALDEGIAVVFVDTKGDNEGVTFIGTDNEAGAAIAGGFLCDNVEAGGKVAILQGIITQSTGQARADGGAAAVTACGLDLVAEIPANWDTAEGQSATDDILVANPDLAGIFASNDNMALGAVEAIAAAGIAPGGIVLIGFGANPSAAQAVLDGTMDATVAQSPYNMGWLGIESLVKLINGESLEAIVDTGTELVTIDNASEYVGS